MQFRIADQIPRIQIAFASLAFGLSLIAQAAAQPYPTRPIQIISPFSAGSAPDALLRLVGQKLSERLGQNVSIDNRPGAGATIATKAAAIAEPNGYNLLQANAIFAYGSTLYPNAGYDPVRSFAPVASLAGWSHFLIVPASVPARTVTEFVAYTKTNSGQVNIGFPTGAPPQVLAEMFKSATRAELNSIPYRQVPQLMADLLGGRIHAVFGAAGPFASLLQEGKVRALVYTGTKRYAPMPDVPTVVESGLPQLALNPSDWTGIVAPTGTPATAITALNYAINETLRLPEIQANIARQGAEPSIMSTAEFAQFLAAESKKWPSLVTQAGLKAE